MNKIATIAAMGLLAGPMTAQAEAIDLLGDIDCFGTGFACVDGFYGAGDEDAFNAFTGAMTPDATSPVTDSLSNLNGQSWTHTLALDGLEDTAVLEFRTYALAEQRGPYDILVNGTSVGMVNLIDAGSLRSSQQIITHSFSFSSALLQNGINSISVTKLDELEDTWALDYSSLKATTVPEPGALALLGLGLAGLGFSRRRRTA